MEIKNRAQTNPLQNNRGTNQQMGSITNSSSQRCHIVVLYTKSLSESIRNICSKHRIQVYFRGGRTIKDLLVSPKDKDPITKMSGVIYRYTNDRVECDEEYIGESSKTFG